MRFAPDDYDDAEVCSCWHLNAEAGEYGHNGYHFDAEERVIDRCPAYWKSKGMEVSGETRDDPRHTWRKRWATVGGTERLLQLRLRKVGEELET